MPPPGRISVDLVTLEEIRRVKYRYLRAVDLKHWDELAGVFTPDATVDYGTQVYGKPLKLDGRDAIVGFLRKQPRADHDHRAPRRASRRSPWTATRPRASGRSRTP